MSDCFEGAPLLFHLDVQQRHIRAAERMGLGLFVDDSRLLEAAYWLDFNRECYALESGL